MNKKNTHPSQIVCKTLENSQNEQKLFQTKKPKMSRVMLNDVFEALTWSAAPDCPSPFCSFLGSFSRMVKIQSSLPKLFPPDAWPSCSLIGRTLKELDVYRGGGGVIVERFKEDGVKLTSRTHPNWTPWFSTALPSTSCTCPPARSGRRSFSRGARSVCASVALWRSASLGKQEGSR